MNGLTDRELQVVKAILEGYTSNKAIHAYFLQREGRSPSPHTIALHLFSVYRKLGVADRVQLVLLAVRLGYPVTWSGNRV